MISCFSDEISPLLHEQLEMLDSLGIDALELRSMWNTGVLDLSPLQLQDIYLHIRDHGKRVTCVSSPIGKCPYDFPFERSLEQLDKAFNAARILNTDKIRIFAWQLGDMVRDDALFQEVCRRLGIMAERAENEGMCLVMENSAVTAANTGANCRKIIEAVNSGSLRLAFDPASFLSAGEAPFDESFRDAKDVIAYVHIKDMCRGASGRVPAGQGDGQLPQLVKAFSANSDLCLSLEPHLSHFGNAGGFSGPENFKKAFFALKDLLN